MRAGFVIWGRELGSCFLSPVAYVTLVLFLAVSGWAFLQMAEGYSGTAESLPGLLFRVVIFLWLPVLSTVITMRLFAEEKHSGTIESLMTAPVSELDVVLGKYAGALTFVVAVALPAISSLCILAYLSAGLSIRALDLGAIAGGVMMLFLMAASCTAMGLLASLLTRNQVVAAMTCFACILVPLVAGQMLTLTSFMPAGFAGYVSADEHVLLFSRGVIDTRPIILYVSLTILLLFVSVRVLESRRWR